MRGAQSGAGSRIDGRGGHGLRPAGRDSGRLGAACSGMAVLTSVPLHAVLQTRDLPFNRNVTIAPIRNTTNRILAMPAAPAAIPPKPKTAAINAITRKTAA